MIKTLNNNSFDHPIFTLGFRTFFALSGVSALVLMVLWRSMYDGSLIVSNYFTPNYWHAHEMLLGYTVAVITGFLLTAVKDWTGEQTLMGRSLAALGVLWLYGRVLPFYSGLLPDELIAIVDFSFLPALILSLARPIFAVNYTRGYVFLGMLSLMMIGNGLIHLDILGWTKQTLWAGFQLVIALIITMILVISGRVFPFFIEKALPRELLIRNPVLDGLAVASSLLMFLMTFLEMEDYIVASCAITAAIINMVRFSYWCVYRVWFIPLLWVLHIGYAWIILGFILIALSAYQFVLPTLALHAFTMGGVGVITLGMMARVSLGHTGRVLKASGTMAIAFALINLGVLVRVVMPIILPGWYADIIYAATLLWLAAFSLFAFIYGPILTTARTDGKAE